MLKQFASLIAATSVLLALGPITSAAAGAGPAYAPVNRPGPALRPSATDMDKAVQCHGDFTSGKEPVLLVPGTFFTVDTQFSWSWGRALTLNGIPWCGVSPPQNSLGDISIAGEYDVYAIRKTYHLAGNRPIAVVGHSQGGMNPRWALRFWPDVRPMLADMVGVAPTNQGASFTAAQLVPPLLNLACSAIACPQGILQQLAGSHFVQALNSRQETFPGIDYTVVYSRTDGGIQPPDTVLHPSPGTDYRRIMIQSICPLDIADHLTNGSIDAVSWALILDAITHPGPADPARISKAVCSQLVFPGIDITKVLGGALYAPLQVAVATATAPRMTHEAPLPGYAVASAPQSWSRRNPMRSTGPGHL